MDVEASDALRMDFQNLISCIECHEESKDEKIVLETLKTIIDICDNESSGRDAFREEGGLDFLVEFMFTTDNTVYLEYILKTLAFIIDGNIHSQIYLTKRSVFEVIQAILQKDAFPKMVRKNALLLISSILYQNSSAQVLVLEIGLIHDLLNIFQCGVQSLLDNNLDTFATEVWITVNSTLCFAVNNPQNEKNQDICSAIFPVSLKLLESSLNPTVIRSLSSFLSLSIANNVRCQDKFAECDGLHILKRFFQICCDAVALDVEECNNVIGAEKLQKINNLIGIISASAADHAKNSALCGKLGLLSLMIKLLFVDNLDISLKTKIILCLGHCIDSCLANKSYVLDTNNFDSLLKESLEFEDHELSNASKYLLQVCLISEDNDKTLPQEKRNIVGSTSLSENLNTSSSHLNICTKEFQDVYENASNMRKFVKSSQYCSPKVKIKNDLNEELFLIASPCRKDKENSEALNKKRKKIFLSPSSNKSRNSRISSTSTHVVKQCRSPESTHSHSCNTTICLKDSKKSGSVCSHAGSLSLLHQGKTKSDGFVQHKTGLSSDRTSCQDQMDEPLNVEFQFTPIIVKTDTSQRKRQVSPASVSSRRPKKQTLADVTNFDIFSKESVDSNAKRLSMTPVKRCLVPERFQTPTKSRSEILRPPKLKATRTGTQSSQARKLLCTPNSEKHIDVENTPSVASDCSWFSSVSKSNSRLLKRKLQQEPFLQPDVMVLKNCTTSRQPVSIRESAGMPVDEFKRRKRSQATYKTAGNADTGYCEIEQSSFPGSCMEVLVLPGERCEQHNLISSFEMLEVVSLDDVNLPESD